MNGYSGQNFLINKEKIKKVIDALDLKSNDTVIEIGAGHGEITKNLKSQISNLKIIAIEKDKKFVEFLRQKFASDKNVKIVEGDVLKILKFYILHLKSYKLVGNIPFYITGYLLRVISELKLKPELAVFIVQKEVAQRIVSCPPQMNLLAASVGFWLEPKIIDYISKKEFKPAPRVDAGIIILRRISTADKKINSDKYYKLIKILFKQPRKTILNNLFHTDSRGLEHGLTRINKEKIIEKLQKIGVNPQSRPQNLEIKQLQQLSTLF